ncbi:MAG: 16S rRNA (cytidine(1402)-2'-O)-methyltransferase [Planctomycetes bacterium]|nr:16S rRNA (cytidine(1402)-2'-O)-methyltransferase [Planctomycetota bacterium]
MTGILYLVSTPIGNLEDITLRALRVLKEVDLIACEDTRQAAKLLRHYQFKKPLRSYFEHNKFQRAKFILEELAAGKKIALISNAGTPLVSDPGYELVRQCLARDIKVIPVPGPTALISALIISGLPPDRFVFEGFLPLKPAKRKKRLAALRSEPRTIIFYVSPYKLRQTLELILEYLGDRPIGLVKELTKLYENSQRGRVSEILERLQDEKIRGEYTLLVKGFE